MMQFFNPYPPYPNDCQPVFFIPGLHTLTPGCTLDGVPVEGPQAEVQPPPDQSSTSWISEAVAEAANEQRTPTDAATDQTCLGGPNILYLNDLWRFTSGIFEPPPGTGIAPRSEAGRRLLKRRQQRQQQQQQVTVQPTGTDDLQQCKGSLPVEELLAFITDDPSLKQNHQNTNDSKTTSERRRSGASRKKESKLTDLTSSSSSDDREDVNGISQKHQEMMRIEKGNMSKNSEDVFEKAAQRSRGQLEIVSGSPLSSVVSELQDEFVVVRRNRKLKCSSKNTASCNERQQKIKSTTSKQSEKHQLTSPPVHYGVDGFQRKNDAGEKVEWHPSQVKPAAVEKKPVIIKSQFTDLAGQTRMTSGRPAAWSTPSNSCSSSTHCRRNEELQQDEKQKISDAADSVRNRKSSEDKLGTIPQNETCEQLNETERLMESSVTSVDVAWKADDPSTCRHAGTSLGGTGDVIVDPETPASADGGTEENQTCKLIESDVIVSRGSSKDVAIIRAATAQLTSSQSSTSVDPVVFLDVQRRSGRIPSNQLIQPSAADIDISFGFDADDTTDNIDDRSTSSSSSTHQLGSCSHCGARSDCLSPRACNGGVKSTKSGSCRVDPVGSAAGVIDVHCHVVVHQVTSFHSPSGRVLPLHAPLSGTLNYCSPSRAPVGIVPPIQQQWEVKNTGDAGGASPEILKNNNIGVTKDPGHVPDVQLVLRLQNSDTKQQQQLTVIKDKCDEMKRNSESSSYIDEDDNHVESVMNDGQFDLLGMQIFLYKGFEEALVDVNGSSNTDIKSRSYK